MHVSGNLEIIPLFMLLQSLAKYKLCGFVLI